MRGVVLALLLAVLSLAAPAAGQENPFAPLPTPAPPLPETVVVAPGDDGDGLDGWQQLLIFGAGIVLLGGIAYAIISDARRRAPVKEREMAHPGLGGPVKHNRTQKERERSRAKAKTARAQRKRNRRRGR